MSANPEPRTFPKISMLVFILITGGVIGYGVTLSLRQKEDFKMHISGQLAATASLKATQVEQWRRERLGDGSALMATPGLVPLIRECLSEQGTEAQKQEVLDWLRAYNRHNQSRRALLLDAHLVPSVSVPPATNVAEATRALAQAAVRSGQPVLSDFYRAGDGAVLLDLVVPLPEAGGAALVFEVDPRLHLYPMVQAWPTHEQSAEVLLLRRDAGDLVLLNEARDRTRIPLNYRPPLVRGTICERASRGEAGFLEGTDYRGNEVLSIVRKVPGTDWVLLVKVDKAEILEALAKEKVHIYLGITTAVVCIGHVFGFFWVRRARTAWRAKLEKEREREMVSQRLLHITRQANDGILLFNSQRRVIDANDRALAMYGYPFEEFMALNVEDLQWPEERREVESAWARLENDLSLVVEAKHRCRDGSSMLVEASVRAVDVQGQRFYQALVRDITERKLREEQLRKLSRAVEQSPTSIVITDRSGRIEYVNPKFCEVTGYTEFEAVGKNPRILKSGELSHDVYRELWDTITAGGTWKGEFHNRRKNGDLFWEFASISGIRNDAGEVTHFLAIKEDITERKRIEQALRDDEEKLRKITTAARDAMVMLDRNGTICLWNESAGRIFGYSQAEAAGRNLHALLTPPRYNGAHHLGLGLLRHGEDGPPDSKTGEGWALRKDGTEIPVEVSVSGVAVKDQWHVLGLIRDISERKKAELERENLIKQLEEALANVKTLSGLIPICAGCKKIRDDTGYWSQVESYLSAHSEAKFSHGICPDCIRRLYPEFANLEVSSKTSKPAHHTCSHTAQPAREPVPVPLLKESKWGEKK